MAFICFWDVYFSCQPPRGEAKGRVIFYFSLHFFLHYLIFFFLLCAFISFIVFSKLVFKRIRTSKILFPVHVPPCQIWNVSSNLPVSVKVQPAILSLAERSLLETPSETLVALHFDVSLSTMYCLLFTKPVLILFHQSLYKPLDD